MNIRGQLKTRYTYTAEKQRSKTSKISINCCILSRLRDVRERKERVRREWSPDGTGTEETAPQTVGLGFRVPCLLWTTDTHWRRRSGTTMGRETRVCLSRHRSECRGKKKKKTTIRSIRRAYTTDVREPVPRPLPFTRTTK